MLSLTDSGKALKPLMTLPLLLAGLAAAATPDVSECFKVHALIKMDQDHYWADWSNACPYTIDSVYVMIRFASKSSIGLGDGVWGLHFVTPGTHRVIRFTAPLSVPDFDSVQVRKITTDSAEALNEGTMPELPRQPQFVETVAAVERVLVAEPPRPTLDQSSSASDHHRRGRELLQQGQYREAVEELSEAIRQQPDSSLAYNARGFAHYMARNYKQALEDLDEAIRLNPKYQNAYRNRSQSRKAIGDRAGSAEDAQKAHALAAGSGL